MSEDQLSEAAQRLKGLRERAGLSVRELARALKRRPSSYQWYESKDYKKDHLPMDLVKSLVPIFKERGIKPGETMELSGATGLKRLKAVLDVVGEEQDDEDFVPTEEQVRLEMEKKETAKTALVIPEYDVRASMGGGFYIDAESVRGYWPFDRSYLVNELRLTPGSLVVIEVIGDSMEPTLRSGDRVLVDMSDQRVGIPGVFVLFDGDGTVAKRVEKIPDSDPGKVRLISDNQHHGSYEVLGEHVNIVGRVVWFARRM